MDGSGIVILTNLDGGAVCLLEVRTHLVVAGISR